jgi:hypothetical protein
MDAAYPDLDLIGCVWLNQQVNSCKYGKRPATRIPNQQETSGGAGGDPLHGKGRGSTVRVRQRASTKPCKLGLYLLRPVRQAPVPLSDRGALVARAHRLLLSRFCAGIQAIADEMCANCGFVSLDRASFARFRRVPVLVLGRGLFDDPREKGTRCNLHTSTFRSFPSRPRRRIVRLAATSS